MRKRLLILTLLSFFCSKLFSTNRTLYVDEFSIILGSPYKEKKLLSFASKYGFDTLILYELNKVDKQYSLTDPRKNNILAEFIAQAKLKYGISKIGVSGESADFFTDRIQIYNNSRTKPEEKVDVYNLEFEYWSKKASGVDGYYCINYLEENNKPCTRQGSFSFFIDNLKTMKDLANKSKNDIKVEAYVGYYSSNEIREISKYCDRILVHSKGKNPKVSFQSSKKNLENLNKSRSNIKTSILISATMSDMGYYLKHDSLENTEGKFFKEMNTKNINLIKNINFGGFSYRTYSFLEKSLSYYSYSKN